VLVELDNRAREATSREIGVDNLPAVAARNAQEPGLATLYAVASATANDPSPASHQYFRERYEVLVRETAHDVEVRQRSGEYRADIDPKWGARLLISVFDGIQLQWLHDRKSVCRRGC